VGVVTPAILPALVAAFTTFALIQFIQSLTATYVTAMYVVAYVSGTLGSLIGADLLNLGKLGMLRSGHASIGGAGTFDGVFISGLLAMFFI
jgi:uncharacterized membrane protein